MIRASSHVIYTKFLDAILISEPTVLHSKLSAASEFSLSVFGCRRAVKSVVKTVIDEKHVATMCESGHDSCSFVEL